MNGRLLSSFIALLVLTPLAIGLLVAEEPLGTKKAAAVAATEIDKLAGLIYTKTSRDENFKRMGLRDDQIAGVKKYIEARSKAWSTDDPQASLIVFLLGQTEDGELLENSLCGRVSPARYTALRLLVEERDDKSLEVRELGGLPRFEPQEWYDKDRPARLAEAVDVVDNRKDDATPMALAAVFARQVQTALEHKSPWGIGLLDSWSWDRVIKNWPEVEGKIERYLATFHLLMENVTAEDGLCRTQ